MNVQQIEFRAKDRFTRKWIAGDLLKHIQGGTVLVTGNGTYEIDIETLGMRTTSACYRGRVLYEHDIVFEEIEGEEIDDRVYYIVTYVEEMSRFALLDYYQYRDYLTNGTNFFDENFEYSMEGVEEFHYAGNYFDNKDTIIDALGGHDITTMGYN